MKNNTKKAKTQKFPPGWNEERVRKVLAHYENQSEDEAVAEDEAAFEAEGQAVMIVPTDDRAPQRRLEAPRREVSGFAPRLDRWEVEGLPWAHINVPVPTPMVKDQER
jgi:hypothetical protein